jgi:dTMP kinase
MSEELFKDGSNRPGMLVTIDGPNGSGKTSLTEVVTAELEARGAAVYSTHQPSSGALGQFARSSEAELRGRGLACLVAADRHQQVEGEVASHLGAGEIVLCDRYIESSLVLQRIDGVEVEFIVAVNAGIPRPDLRIVLRAEPETLHERLAAREPDPARRFEQTAAGARELRLYEEADRFLAETYGLPAVDFDTTSTDAAELGRQVAPLIEAKWSAGHE